MPFCSLVTTRSETAYICIIRHLHPIYPGDSPTRLFRLKSTPSESRYILSYLRTRAVAE
jgi:hypothetical protein